MKKSTILTLAIIWFCGFVGSLEAYAEPFAVETAKVVKSEPIYVTVQGQKCHEVTVNVDVQDVVPAAQAPKQERSMLGAIAGGALGGLLGHQVGGGTGNTLATIVGAAGGAMMGDKLGNRNVDAANEAAANAQPKVVTRTVQKTAQVCEPTTEQKIAGYNVTFRYNGKTYTQQMLTQPGATVQVGMTVIQ